LIRARAACSNAAMSPQVYFFTVASGADLASGMMSRARRLRID